MVKNSVNNWAWVVCCAFIALIWIGCRGAATGPDVGVDAPAGNDAPTSATTQTPDASEPNGEITLRWVTYSQFNVKRFEVYRGPSREGPWELISQDVLLMGEPVLDTRSGKVDPKEYVFTDTGLTPGESYWYYIGKVDLANRRSRYTRNPQKFIATVPAPIVEEPTAAPEAPTAKTAPAKTTKPAIPTDKDAAAKPPADEDAPLPATF